MNREQILNAVRTLAASQGFYGRLYDEAEVFLDLMVDQNFCDTVDMVMWLES